MENKFLKIFFLSFFFYFIFIDISFAIPFFWPIIWYEFIVLVTPIILSFFWVVIFYFKKYIWVINLILFIFSLSSVVIYIDIVEYLIKRDYILFLFIFLSFIILILIFFKNKFYLSIIWLLILSSISIIYFRIDYDLYYKIKIVNIAKTLEDDYFNYISHKIASNRLEILYREKTTQNRLSIYIFKWNKKEESAKIFEKKGFFVQYRFPAERDCSKKCINILNNIYNSF